MPANTPKGLPYPLPAEPVAEGAQAIRNLAEAVDARLALLDDYLLASAGLYDTDARLGVNGIPQSYRDLVLSVVGNQTAAAFQYVRCMINGLSTGYYWERLYSSGATVTASEGINTADWDVSLAGASSGYGFATEITFPNYAEGVKRFYRSEWFSSDNNSTGTIRRGNNGGVQPAATAIVRVQLSVGGGANFAAGTRFTLYGRR